ncbi:MAG: NlpC/P60 family protein [Verrucomicrobiales bacterium]|nr:NlpC/P60 family protein [Verrucomicrobiales bacterium]
MKYFVQPCWVLGLTLFSQMALALEPASVASISPEDLVEFDTQPAPVQELIRQALTLTEKKLTYQFGSNSPGNAGMDCSGSVQCVLKASGVDELPRTSFGFYEWARDKGDLVETRAVHSTDDPAFDELKPGDLLFWTGTYSTTKRNPPISHVMIFLGRLKTDGQGVVFGSSDGRRFRGKRITGVSVFDWRVPSAESKSKFVAYGPIPGFEDLREVPVVEEEEPRKPLKSIFDRLLKKQAD